MKGTEGSILKAVMKNKDIKTGYLIKAYIDVSDSIDKTVLEVYNNNNKEGRRSLTEKMGIFMA